MAIPDYRDELITALAGIVSGLAAPYSIDSAMLGTAGPEWVKVRELLHLHGWNTKEECEEELRLHLADALQDDCKACGRFPRMRGDRPPSFGGGGAAPTVPPHAPG